MVVVVVMVVVVGVGVVERSTRDQRQGLGQRGGCLAV